MTPSGSGKEKLCERLRVFYFAPSGRKNIYYSFYPGRCPGLVYFALSGRKKEKDPPILHRGLFKVVVATLPGVYAMPPAMRSFGPSGLIRKRNREQLRYPLCGLSAERRGNI